MTCTFVATARAGLRGRLRQSLQRADTETMLYRSRYNGLSPRQSLELQDALGTPARLSMTSGDAARDVHDEYARRTVVLLSSNDLLGALDAAALATAARLIYEGQPPGKVIGGREPVIHQHPASTGSESAGGAGTLHRDERVRALG